MIKKVKSFVGNNWLILLLLLTAFLVRLYFVDKAVILSGDLLVHKEWGERFWIIGAKNFYFDENWYYSKPTQPPFTSLIFAGAYYLYDHRYRLAELHNIIKFPPAAFIIYFGKWGYELMLKTPGILGDIFIGGLIYVFIIKMTSNRRRAVLGMSLYIFNPVSIFISGVWGQTESLIAFFALLSFYLLTDKYIWLSPLFMFLSIYTKPTWIVFLPLYIFCLIFVWKNKKVKLRNIIFGIILSLLALIIVTKPFSGSNIISFIKYTTLNNMLPAAKGTIKATTSAFNFNSIFFRLDVNLATDKYLVLPANNLGYIILTYLYLVMSFFINKNGVNPKTILISGFIIGSGATIFLTGMLERYLFIGFPFLLIIGLCETKYLKYFIIFNITLFLNLIWAFFRRSHGEVDHVFTDHGMLLIRIISIINVLIFILFVRSNISKNLLKLGLWKK
jgi:Gpi18-like mannosyltransferase